jgi:hypothetical protein
LEDDLQGKEPLKKPDCNVKPPSPLGPPRTVNSLTDKQMQKSLSVDGRFLRKAATQAQTDPATDKIWHKMESVR